MALIDWLQSRLDQLSTAFFATLALLFLLGLALVLQAFRWGDGAALDEDDETTTTRRSTARPRTRRSARRG